MPESLLMIEHRAEEELGDLKQKFHPHHDYLSLIIPSTWLSFGILVTDLYFYRSGHVRAVLSRFTDLRPFFQSACTSLEFFLALGLFIMAFASIYVIGQIVNGLSAMMLDRLVVKKLLKYPFSYYRMRLAEDDSIDDRKLFRTAVLRSSYLVLCTNLIPITFIEIVAVVFTHRVHDFPIWLDQHPAVILSGLASLLYFHFGRPSLAKPRRSYIASYKATSHFAELFGYHIAMLAIVGIVLALLILGAHNYTAVLVLPVINLLIGGIERLVMKDWVYKKPYAEDFYNYARACFTNPIYLAAKLVGYGDAPSRSIIDTVNAAVPEEYNNNDLFWMTYLAVQNYGSGSRQTMYHFLASYAMVRNLCNATALIVVSSVGAFWLRWPTDHEHAVVIWTFAFSFLMYALFARYLYLYGSYFSKYVVRAAAFIYREHGAQSKDYRPSDAIKAKDKAKAGATKA